MNRIPSILVAWLLSIHQIFAIGSSDIGFQSGVPVGGILTGTRSTSLISLLTLVQSILLKAVLPLVVVGASLYIAYELFTAEGDESKMKKAWKSVAYTAVALISIALSYGLVSIIARLSI